MESREKSLKRLLMTAYDHAVESSVTMMLEEAFCDLPEVTLFDGFSVAPGSPFLIS